MLLTESLDQFQLLLEREMRGEVIELEPGYAEFYAKWKKSKEESLPKLSSEERAQLVSDDLQEEVSKRQEELINKKWISGDAKKNLLSQAKRGDLLLVSTDEGKHFDEVMTLEEVQKQDPLKVRVLSSTLVSTTTDFERVKEEQNLLHVSKNLRANHCLVERGSIENHVIRVDIVHTRFRASVVEVDLQNEKANLDYVFKNKDGEEKRVSETQLPEEFGLVEEDPRLATSTPMNMGFVVNEGKQDFNANLKAGEIGALATLLSKTSLEASALNDMRAKALLLKENQENTEFQNGKNQREQQVMGQRAVQMMDAESRYISHVMDSKKQVAERLAAQIAANQAQQMTYRERVEKYRMAQRAQAIAEQEEQKRKKQLQAKSQTTRKVAAMAGSALTGGLSVGFGGLAWWINHVNSL